MLRTVYASGNKKIGHKRGLFWDSFAPTDTVAPPKMRAGVGIFVSTVPDGRERCSLND